MATKRDFAAEALTWVGTPFVHAQATKGAGCDCKGLIEGSARALGLPEAEHPSMRHNSRGGRFTPEELLHHLGQVLRPVPIEEAKSGDVILFSVRHAGRHLGILTDDGIVHTLDTGRRRVELTQREVWMRFALAAWELPSLHEAEA